MQITLDQLLALEAIVRTGSFARAAAELHRVPSAVSYLVRGLESATGLELFDRSKRQAVLTPAGSRLLEHAKSVLDGAHGLEALAVELRSGWEAELRVVVDGALPFGPVTQVLRRFADPDVPTFLRVDIEYQEGVLHRFEKGRADIALVLGFESGGSEAGFDCKPLGTLELLLVASPSHPLADVELTPENRQHHAELVVRDSSPAFEAASKPSFMGSRNVVYLSDFFSKRMALLEGAGYGWIPRHFIASDLKREALVVLKAETNSWAYQPQVVVREGQELGRAGRLFLETLDPPLEALEASKS